MNQEQKLEELLQGLWERVQRAGDLISSLRSEKTALAERVSGLESQLRSVQVDLTDQKKQLLEKNSIVESLLQKQAHETDNARILSNGEREAIAAKAKELLERIQGYL